MTNKDKLTIYIEPELRKKVVELAKKERRSLSNLLCNLCKDAINKEG